MCVLVALAAGCLVTPPLGAPVFQHAIVTGYVLERIRPDLSRISLEEPTPDYPAARFGSSEGASIDVGIVRVPGGPRHVKPSIDTELKRQAALGVRVTLRR